MPVANEQVGIEYTGPLLANAGRALSPAAEYAVATFVDAVAIVAARIGLGRAGVLDRPAPPGPTPEPPTVGGGDDAPRAAPPRMLPMWTADP